MAQLRLENEVDQILMGERRPEEYYVALIVKVLTNLGKNWAIPHMASQAPEFARHLVDEVKKNQKKRVAYIAPTYPMVPEKDLSKMSDQDSAQYIRDNAEFLVDGASDLAANIATWYDLATTAKNPFPFDTSILAPHSEALSVLEAFRRHHCPDTKVDSVYFIGHGQSFSGRYDDPTLPMQRASSIILSIKGLYPPVGLQNGGLLKVIWDTCSSRNIVAGCDNLQQIPELCHLTSNGDVRNVDSVSDLNWVDFSLARSDKDFEYVTEDKTKCAFTWSSAF